MDVGDFYFLCNLIAHQSGLLVKPLDLFPGSQGCVQKIHGYVAARITLGELFQDHPLHLLETCQVMADPSFEIIRPPDKEAPEILDSGEQSIDIALLAIQI